MAKQTFTTGQVLTAAQVNSLQANDFNQTVSVKTADYTLVAADKGTRIEFNTSGSVTCTVNSGLFDAGDTLIIQNRGAGAVTVTAGTATVDTSATLILSQYDSGTLYFVSASASIFFNSDAGGATPLTTKGDLYTFGTSDTRLAVGANGETLVADSSTTTGLRWSADWNTGKNKIINGDFRIWQRGTSFTPSTGALTYTADRWQCTSNHSAGTPTISQQTFTPGSAPVAGYEGQFFLRFSAASTSSFFFIDQKIEDVRTLAGQTITVSFWAKVGSATSMRLTTEQNFGSGGSASEYTDTDFNITTSWARYSATITLGSMSSKTIGTSSFLMMRFQKPSSASSVVFDIWGVQVEAGSVATPFTTATGTLAGELAACQRYYYLVVSGDAKTICPGWAFNSLDNRGVVTFPVTMRAVPTLVATSGTNYYYLEANNGTDNFNSLTILRPTTTVSALQNNTEAGSTGGVSGTFITNNAAASVAFNAEL